VGVSLRDRKRARTRQAIVAAAAELFESRGYDETTIAEIAQAAEIGTRTFFSYFASKEDLLFPDTEERVRAALEAIAERAPQDGPAEVLLRALQLVGENGDDLTGRLAALRMHLIRTVPAIRGRGLQIQMDVQREIARQLASPARSTRWARRRSPGHSSARSPGRCRCCWRMRSGCGTRRRSRKRCRWRSGLR
jgi:AcrR family transcriptional regulator